MEIIKLKIQKFISACYNPPVIKKIILGILLNAAALYGVVYFLPSITYTGDLYFFGIGGLVMGLLNSIVKPILKILTLPLHILTMGLSLIFLNGVIFWIFHQVIDTMAIAGIGMTVPTIKLYFLAGFIFGIINWFEHLLVHNK